MPYKQLLSLPAFQAITWVGTALSIIFCSLRAYIRIRLFRRLLLDDWLMFFALLMLIATAAIQQPTIKFVYELLRNRNDKAQELSPTLLHDGTIGAHAFGITGLFYTLGIYSVKLSFLVFFYRLGSHITLYLALWWVVVLITVGFCAVAIGIPKYSCEFRPIDEILQDCSEPTTLAITVKTFTVIMAMDLITDALIILFPMLIIWRVRVSIRKKIILGGVFGLVALTMVITGLRSSSFISQDMRDMGEHINNIGWSWFWVHVQLSVSIIIACLVSFRALFCPPSDKTREKEAAREYYQQRRQLRNRANNMVDIPGGVTGRFRQFHNSMLDNFRDLEDSDGMELLPLPPSASANGSRQKIWPGGDELSRLEGGDSSTGRSGHEPKSGQIRDQSGLITPLEPVHHGVSCRPN